MARLRLSVAVMATAALVVLASGCASAAAPIVTPQQPTSRPPTSQLVVAQLDSATTLIEAQGFTLVDGYRGGALAEGGEDVVSLDLTAGRIYMIAAMCDQDCSDLDLELTDASGEVLDSDFELDDVPMVAAEIERTGRYDLAVTMATCSAAPCGYGVAVYVQ